MGERDYFRKDFEKRQSFGMPKFDGPVVTLIIINLVVFTTMLGLWLIYLVIYDKSVEAEPHFSSDIAGNLFLPSEPSEMIRRPWTLVTYMFSQFGFWRLFSNMLWLWTFGRIFQLIAGNEKVYPVYLYSGLAAGIAFVIASMLNISGAGVLVGAGAAVMGLAIAVTTLSPDYRLFPMLANGIPLWVVTAIFVILDLSAIASSPNLLMAHAAAAVAGFLYVHLLRSGRDTGAWMGKAGDWFMDLFNPGKKYEKGQHFYDAKKEPFVKKPNLTQKKLDELLDKIHQQGYESLTEPEKEFLKKASDQID